MATVTIPWSEGEGNLYASFVGSGNGSLSLTSDDNPDCDRSQGITVHTLAGTPKVSFDILVSQPGLREPFLCIDGKLLMAGEEDTDTFNVLKSGVTSKYSVEQAEALLDKANSFINSN